MITIEFKIPFINLRHDDSSGSNISDDPVQNIIEIQVQMSELIVLEQLKEKEETSIISLQSAATTALTASVVAQVVTNGSLAQLWGTINGIQLAVYIPLTNVPIPEQASNFNELVAGVVTFDIPNVDMEFVFRSIVECPDEDDILTDLDDTEVLSDQTTLGGISWSELKIQYFYAPNFDRKALYNSLNAQEQETLVKLAEAQELQGWSNELQNPSANSIHFRTALGVVGFSSAYLSRNLGTAFVWVLIATAGLLLIMFTLLFPRVRRVKQLGNWLKDKLLWNAILRTIMQTSLEFGFCCFFTLKYATIDGSFGTLINISYAYIFGIGLLVFPFFCILFYGLKFNTFRHVEFTNEPNADIQETIKRNVSKKDLHWQIKHEQVCSEFYEQEEMQETIEQIIVADGYNKELDIQPVTKDQITFFKLLTDLRYIDSCQVKDDKDPPYATLKLLGRFSRNWVDDMEREKAKQKFMAKFGEPIAGFDLKKQAVVFYPAYFTFIRILFVVVTLTLWHKPLIQLFLRLIIAFAAFVILTVVKPYETKLDNFLELMNECTLIFVIEVLFVFTDVMNAGNINDVNMGTVGTITDLESARQMAGIFYIALFVSNITIHFAIMLYFVLRHFKLTCAKKHTLWRRKVKREKAFQERFGKEEEVDGIRNRSYCAGICFRLCCNKKAFKQDYKLGIIQDEKDEKNLEQVNTFLQNILQVLENDSPMIKSERKLLDNQPGIMKYPIYSNSNGEQPFVQFPSIQSPVNLRNQFSLLITETVRVDVNVDEESFEQSCSKPISSCSIGKQRGGYIQKEKSNERQRQDFKEIEQQGSFTHYADVQLIKPFEASKQTVETEVVEDQQDVEELKLKVYSSYTLTQLEAMLEDPEFNVDSFLDTLPANEKAEVNLKLGREQINKTDNQIEANSVLRETPEIVENYPDSSPDTVQMMCKLKLI